MVAKVQSLDLVRRAFEEAGRRDEGADTCRSLLESGLADCVTALQRLADELYRRSPRRRSAPHNAFQRLKHASELWRDAIGEGYEDWLTPTELSDLSIGYQRRHLLAHRDGIVDAEYLERTADVRYRPGQRLIVTEPDVLRMVELVEKIARVLRDKA